MAKQKKPSAKAELEETRLIAECLVHVMTSVNQYPLKKYQEAAEGRGDLTKLAAEVRTKLVEFYFTLDPEKWNSIANDTPKGRRLGKWIDANFVHNPLATKDE